VPSASSIAGVASNPITDSTVDATTKNPDRPAERTPRAGQIPGADSLPDHHVRRRADTEHNAKHQEHDDVGVGRGGERFLAQQTTDPDRVD
jgi:hypothetical protein